MLKRYWRGLPWDGLGWSGGPDPALAGMRAWAAAEWRLRPGLALAAPQDRLSRLPWNGAPLAGRCVPGFAAAAAMALRAMAALPPLPLVHWDLIPTAAGPVMLEGNSAGNWILATLPGAYGLDAGPLAPLLARWMPPAVAGRR